MSHTFTKRNNRQAATRAFFHIGALGLCSYWIMNAWLMWPVVMVLQGVLLVALFCPLHETIHETAFATKRFNRGFSWVIGFLLLLPPIWFRHYHLAHHRYTQVEGKDPELEFPKPASVKQYLWHMSGLPVLWSKGVVLKRLLLGQADWWYLPPNFRRQAIHQGRIMAGLYLLLVLLIFQGATFLLWLWLLPLLLGEPFLRAFLLAEHAGCDLGPNMLKNSRTTSMTAAGHFFTWNMAFHTAHHQNPGVPFHGLEKFHQSIQAQVVHTSSGYWSFHWHFIQRLRESA